MYNKKGHVTLETTAKIQRKIDTNIRFYNTDVGTANLTFNVTRNKKPLLVSEQNADVFLILKNGGNYIVDTVTPVDPMNGKLEYVIPNEFLSLTGNVKGQLYIAIHGKEEIVTEVEFNFEIKDSLINTIPAVDKLNEIRTFQEFRENIMSTINEINEALEQGEDYVSQMQDTLTSGMKSLNDRSEQVIQEIKNLVDGSKTEITNLKDESIDELDSKADKIKSDIEELNQYDTSDWQKHKITQDDGMVKLLSKPDLNNVDTIFTKTQKFYVTNSTGGPEGESGNAYVDVKFRTSNLGTVTYQAYNSNKIYVRRKQSSTYWSDWELLNPEVNTRTWLGTLGEEGNEYTSVLQLPPGLYECIIPIDASDVDAPQDPNGGSYIAQIDVTIGNSERKQFRLIASAINEEYRGTVHTNGEFKGWKRVQDAEEYEALNSDTGWIDWNTMNGATKRETDDVNAVHCQRRVRMVNGIQIAHLRININNITESGIVVGQIPASMVPKRQSFYARTPVTMNPAVIYLETNGNIKVILNTDDVSKWITSHYVIGELTWIIDDIGSGQ